MDFNFPFLDVLVLPVGATSGERIEIDGTNGEIRIYDVNGDLRITLGGTSSPEDIGFSTGNPSETAQGSIFADDSGPAANENPQLRILSPTFTPNDDWMEIQLRGSSEGGDPATLRLGNAQSSQPHRLGIDGGSGNNKFLETGITLAAGTSGAIANSVVTASSRLWIARRIAVNPGFMSYTVGAGTFTINSSNGADASTVDVLIVEPF
jgi:hypothetical protein